MAAAVLGAVAGLVALFGLWVASAAHSGPYYYFGLIVFAAAVLFIFFIVVRLTRNPPRQDELGPASEP